MKDTAVNARRPALFIAPIMPSDGGNGLAMRTGFLLDAYATRFEIDLAVIPVGGGATAITPFVNARVRRTAVLRATTNTHFALIRAIADQDARLAAFKKYAHPSIASGLGAETERGLLDFTGSTSYEIVHVSRLYLASLAEQWMRTSGVSPRLVLDCDEWDVDAYRRFARLYRKWGQDNRAHWVEAEAEAFRSLATRWLPRFDLLLAASANEARPLGIHAGGAKVAVVPNVVLSSVAHPDRRRIGGKRRDILFVGNMGYPPNVDAVMWFVSRVWPILRAALPLPFRLVIAGPAAPREVQQLARRPGIVIAGRVADLAPLYQRAALAIVPIRAGGGTRIKLLESAWYGVPVVSTRFGASGTGLRSGHELFLADNEQDFAASCARLLGDGRLALRLAAQALRRVRRDYDDGRLAARLLSTIDTLGAE